MGSTEVKLNDFILDKGVGVHTEDEVRINFVWQELWKVEDTAIYCHFAEHLIYVYFTNIISNTTGYVQVVY